MRILSIGNFGYGWDGSICDEEHIAKALEDSGHEVGRCQREHIEFTDGGQWDFTLIAQWDGYSDLSSLPRPLVYWAFDYQADGQEWHERLVKEADLYLSKRLADSKYSNWRWLSQDFAPNFLREVPFNKLPERDVEVLFTGSYLPWATERNETIRAVAQEFSLVVHSVNAWPEEWGLDVRLPIMDEGLPELYARARVILSIDHTIEAGYWSDRNAQIIACGRRPLFRYVPLSETRFHQDVDYFYDTKDCLTKIKDILNRGSRHEGIGWYVSQYQAHSKARDLLTVVESIL